MKSEFNSESIPFIRKLLTTGATNMSQDNSDLFETRNLAESADHIAPDGFEIRLLAQANSGGLAHCTLPVGKTSSAVSYKTVEEIWFLTAGRGQVWGKVKDEERIVDIRPGLSLTIPLSIRGRLLMSESPN